MSTTQQQPQMRAGSKERFEIDDHDAWVDAMETARKLRSDPQARATYLCGMTTIGQTDYMPLYLLLQRRELVELREELSGVNATERHADLSVADSMNRADRSKRIRAAIYNAMLKASGTELCRPAFRTRALPRNSNPTFSTFTYYTDYVFVTEVAEAASVVTTAGAVAEAVILAVALGTNVPQKKMQGSDSLKAAATATEYRAIAEFIAPLLSDEAEYFPGEEGNAQFSADDSRVLGTLDVRLVNDRNLKQ